MNTIHKEGGRNPSDTFRGSGTRQLAPVPRRPTDDAMVRMNFLGREPARRTVWRNTCVTPA
jgi:hypothetical protein